MNRAIKDRRCSEILLLNFTYADGVPDSELLFPNPYHRIERTSSLHVEKSSFRLETVQGVKLVAIGLEDKKQIVSEVNQAANSALSAVLADYRGVTVGELTELRKTARENKVYLRVVRNTLLKLAVDDTDFECIKEVLVGPTILALSEEDPGAAARVLKEFAEGNDEFEIKALSIGGKLLDASQIDVLAKLPTYDQAISILMSLMLALVTKLARTFNEVPAKVTRSVAAVRDQKQEAA